MTHPNLDADAVGQRLKSIIDYVHECERRVNKGEIMDLQGLDQNVMEICDALAGLQPAEGKPMESQMTQLIDGLEVLARAMKEQQDKFISAGGR